MAGLANAPGGWEVRIERPGQAEPLIITSHGSFEAYPCDAVRPGDRVTVQVLRPGAGVVVGNPGLCV